LYLDLIDCYLISKEQYSSYMDDGRVFNNYKTGTAIGAGTAYHYGAHEFTPVFIGCPSIFSNVYLMSFFSNTTSATSGAVTAYPSGHLRLSRSLGKFFVAQSLVFCVVFCKSLFALLKKDKTTNK
jgi:hypothetical protein